MQLQPHDWLTIGLTLLSLIPTGIAAALTIVDRNSQRARGFNGDLEIIATHAVRREATRIFKHGLLVTGVIAAVMGWPELFGVVPVPNAVLITVGLMLGWTSLAEVRFRRRMHDRFARRGPPAPAVIDLANAVEQVAEDVTATKRTAERIERKVDATKESHEQ